MEPVTLKNFKEVYFDTLKKIGIKSHIVQIGAGAALLFYGLREQTEDIDVDIPTDIFELMVSGLEKHPEWVVKYHDNSFNKQIHNINIGYISFHKKSNRRQRNISINITRTGYDDLYITLDHPIEILKMKQKLNREKDQKDIKALKRFINHHSNDLKKFQQVIVSNCSLF